MIELKNIDNNFTTKCRFDNLVVILDNFPPKVYSMVAVDEQQDNDQPEQPKIKTARNYSAALAQLIHLKEFYLKISFPREQINYPS